MRKLCLRTLSHTLVALGAAAVFGTTAEAAGLTTAEAAGLQRSGWFVGLGGSFNTVNFDQNMFAAGDGKVFQGGTLFAGGQAGGPANPRQDTQLTLAPTAQLGYFAHFADSNWLWGAKVFYQYTAATATTPDIDPQAGTLTTVFGTDSFTGHVVIGSYRTRLNHEIAFIPFIGHSFARSYVYLGAGPALFGTQTKIDNAIGFAHLNGIVADVTGTPDNFASSKWVWGGVAQIGFAYYLDHDWSWISTIPMPARQSSRATFRLPTRACSLAILAPAPCSYRHRSALPISPSPSPSIGDFEGVARMSRADTV